MKNKPETVEQAAVKYSGSRQDIFDCFVAGANWQASQHSYTEQKWVSVDLEADVKDTELQHFEQYFIVIAETGKVVQASFLDWETEGVDNTWIIGDAEFPLSFASHYQKVIYPKPPTEIAALCNTYPSPPTYTQEQMIAFGEEIKGLKSQLNKQEKHKQSIKQYWLSCAENKKKWKDAIKEYFDSELTESIRSFDDFKYQFDLD